MRTETLIGDRGAWLVVRVAETRWERMRGLLGAPSPEPGTGLLLERTRSIHTFGMRAPITVALLDRDLRVLAVVRTRPNRAIVPRRGARHVLELGLGTALTLGERLRRVPA